MFVSYFELGLLDFVCFPFESNEILLAGDAMCISDRD